MFIHSFRYSLLQFFRNKTQVFWNLFFPIALATMFHFAFAGLSADEKFDPIPTAVVLKHDSAASASHESPPESDYSLYQNSFRETIDALNEPGDDRLFDAVYTTEEEALSLLEKKEIIGILYEDDPVRLSISAEMTNMKLEQSILNTFVEEYCMYFETIANIASDNPERLPAVIESLSKDVGYIRETSYSDGSMDEMLTYFFNLIAMTCLYAFMGGLQAALQSQANLSALGTRKGISPVPKLLSACGSLLSALVFHFSALCLLLLYLIFALKINFGSEGGFIFFTALIGCIAGISFGFFIGSLGKMNENIKYSLLMAFSMFCSFFSGLMVGNMRILVDQVCPWFNHINPAALITDSFYALSICQSHTRYFENILVLFILSALCCFGGVMMVRRKKYDAL